jgi:hypothetical protein
MKRATKSKAGLTKKKANSEILSIVWVQWVESE